MPKAMLELSILNKYIKKETSSKINPQKMKII